MSRRLVLHGNHGSCSAHVLKSSTQNKLIVNDPHGQAWDPE